MGKVIKKGDRPDFFAQGGKGHMFGRQYAGPAIPGQSATSTAAGPKWAEGGKTHMFGKGHADKAPSGVSIKESQ
jgi:hypothetical protein